MPATKTRAPATGLPVTVLVKVNVVTLADVAAVVVAVDAAVGLESLPQPASIKQSDNVKLRFIFSGTS